MRWYFPLTFLVCAAHAFLPSRSCLFRVVHPWDFQAESQASTLIVVSSIIGLLFALWQFRLIANVK